MTETTFIMREQEVGKASGLRGSTLYREIKAGRFPKPIKISERCVGWRADDVAEWYAAKVEAREPNYAPLPNAHPGWRA